MQHNENYHMFFFWKCQFWYISIFGEHGGNTKGGLNSQTCHFNIYEPDNSNHNFLEPGINVQTNTVMFHRPDFPMANFLARRT